MAARSDTSSPWRCAASSRARSRRRTPFPWPASPVPRQIAVPLGSQSGRPGPTYSASMAKRPISCADLAVVAAFGLFEHGEVGLHLGLVLEGGAVDALELRVLLVALVIGAGHAGELERADVAGAHHVRPGAKVNEIAVLVNRRSARPRECSARLPSLNLLGLPGRSLKPPSRPLSASLHRLLARDDQFSRKAGWP